MILKIMPFAEKMFEKSNREEIRHKTLLDFAFHFKT